MVSYLYSSSEAQKQQQHQQERSRSEYNLHSVQRLSTEKTNKKPVLNKLAQLASGTAQPRVYNVKPIHFRELVQRLTGASPAAIQHHHRQQNQPRARPQPPPISVSPYLLRAQNQGQMSSSAQEQQVTYKVEQAFEAVPEERQLFLDNNKEEGEGLTNELMLSPNFQAWFSLALLSPGSVV